MLIDTAGIRNTDDTVEKIGVEKSIKSIEKADLVVVMIDGSGFFGDEDVEVLHATKNKKELFLSTKPTWVKANMLRRLRQRQTAVLLLK